MADVVADAVNRGYDYVVDFFTKNEGEINTKSFSCFQPPKYTANWRRVKEICRVKEKDREASSKSIRIQGNLHICIFGIIETRLIFIETSSWAYHTIVLKI